MQMDEGLDTGAVFVHSEVPITSDDTAGSLHDKLAAEGAALLAQHLEDIVSGQRTCVPQATEGVSYAEKITPEEAVITWQSDAHEIERRIRAFNPFPGAFTYWKGTRLKVFRAQVLPESSSKHDSPGMIRMATSERLEVQCAEGALALLEVQLQGRRRLPIDEFLKGSNIVTGDKLG